MKRAARVDENHAPIVKALLDAGCSVQSLAAVGLGCPDILVGMAGANILIEIKNPDSRRGKEGLNEEQRSWHRFWKGHVVTVHTAEEAIAAVKAAVLRQAV